MPLARIGYCTVLWSNESFASAFCSAQVARPSSPALRMSLLVTLELVTPLWKLTPSAVKLRSRMPS